jgi:hypothetical protein
MGWAGALTVPMCTIANCKSSKVSMENADSETHSFALRCDLRVEGYLFFTLYVVGKFS